MKYDLSSNACRDLLPLWACKVAGRVANCEKEGTLSNALAKPSKTNFSVDLLHCRATRTSARGSTTAVASARHVRHAAFTTTCRLVDLHHDRVHDAFKLFLLCLKFVLLGKLILIEPIKGFLDCFFNLVLIVALKLIFQLLLLQRVPHREAIVLKTVLCLNLALVRLVLSLEFLRLRNHAVDLRLRQPTLLIRDRDLVRFSSRLVLCRDIQNAVRINVKCDLNLGDTTRCRRDTIEVELSQQVVVLCHCSLTLENLNEHTRLIVCIGGEGLALFRRNGCVPLNQLCHHAAGRLQAHRQWRHIQQEKILDSTVSKLQADLKSAKILDSTVSK